MEAICCWDIAKKSAHTSLTSCTPTLPIKRSRKHNIALSCPTASSYSKLVRANDLVWIFSGATPPIDFSRGSAFELEYGIQRLRPARNYGDEQRFAGAKAANLRVLQKGAAHACRDLAAILEKYY